MAAVDPQSIYVLEALPSKHRRHLLDQNARHYPARASMQQKLEVLARRIGPRDIMRYSNLYLDHNPRLFVWYLQPDSKTKLGWFYNSIHRRYGSGVFTGLEPDLEDDGPAELNRLIDIRNVLILEFGIRDRIRNVLYDWKPKKYRSDSVYRVIVKTDPLTLEVRATGAETQDKLVKATGIVLNRNLEEMLRCDLSPASKYNALQHAFGARFCGVVHAATGEGLSRSSLDADEITGLETTSDYITQSAHAYRTESSRKYEFFYAHVDGYRERVRYEVSLLSGDVKMNSQVSETAVESLRQNVVELF